MPVPLTYRKLPESTANVRAATLARRDRTPQSVCGLRNGGIQISIEVLDDDLSSVFYLSVSYLTPLGLCLLRVDLEGPRYKATAVHRQIDNLEVIHRKNDVSRSAWNG
jgi:hypothetical protein